MRQKTIPAAFAAVTASRADALHAFGNPVNSKQLQLIADFALRNLLPSSYEERASLWRAVFSRMRSSFIDTYQRSASYVDKILKGAKPG